MIADTAVMKTQIRKHTTFTHQNTLDGMGLSRDTLSLSMQT